MALQKRSGRLSLDEQRWINENSEDYTYEEIANRLNRREKAIRNYIKNHGLKVKDVAQGNHLLYALRHRYYYDELKKQLTRDELRFFEQNWVDFLKQFNEDVTHTEELQILEVIRTEILINRSMEDRKEIIEAIRTIEKLIDEEMKLPPDQRDKATLSSLNSQLGALIGSKGSHINEHEKLLKKKEIYLKQLKGTREQRKRIADDAKTNFLLWLRQLDELEQRKIEGDSIIVHAAAAEKERKRLSELHEYIDGEVDQPLLNAENVILNEEED